MVSLFFSRNLWHNVSNVHSNPIPDGPRGAFGPASCPDTPDKKFSMPAAYAHYRFGQEVIARLDPAQQRAISACRELFDIGLHGPDLFFYHNPLGRSPVSRLGHRMHSRPAGNFFLPALSLLPYLAHPAEGRAYLYGFLCHFALDASCHPYVEKAAAETGLTHMEIESEFDRRLMLHDGRNPLTHFPAGHIRPSRRNAEIISAFFPSRSPREVLTCLYSMRVCCRLLLAPHPPKRALIHAVLALSGNSDSMRGLLISRRAVPAARESNRQLLRCYHEALPLACYLIRACQEGPCGQSQLADCLKRSFD